MPGAKLITSFFQHDSRDHDPQFHIHNPVLNRVAGDDDGEWRALDSRAIHKFRPAAAAVAERTTEERLAATLRVRLAMRPDGKAREVAGGLGRVADQALAARAAGGRDEAGTRQASGRRWRCWRPRWPTSSPARPAGLAPTSPAPSTTPSPTASGHRRLTARSAPRGADGAGRSAGNSARRRPPGRRGAPELSASGRRSFRLSRSRRGALRYSRSGPHRAGTAGVRDPPRRCCGPAARPRREQKNEPVVVAVGNPPYRDEARGLGAGSSLAMEVRVKPPPWTPSVHQARASSSTC